MEADGAGTVEGVYGKGVAVAFGGAVEFCDVVLESEASANKVSPSEARDERSESG